MNLVLLNAAPQGKLEADLGKAKDATETRRLLESEILEQ